MKGKMLLAAVGAALGLTLVLAGMTTGAGAAGSARGKPAISPPTRAVVAKRTPSPAAARRLALLRTADLSTNAGAFKYLRSVGLDPRTVVIQRGTRNYAGPKCPGKKWTCTTSRRVLQMGAINTYLCAPRTSGSSPNDCTIIQNGGGTATCSETSTANGVTQNCSITQANTTTGANNNAVVVQILTQSGTQSGTQAATQNASIAQSQTHGGSNNAGVTQNVIQLLGRGAAALNDDDNNADDFTSSTSSPISQQQDAYQRLSVTQTSSTGSNTSAILQTQLQRERADRSTSSITQLQNTVAQDESAYCPEGPLDLASANPNQCNRVQQTSTSGKNSVNVRQDYREFQAASNTATGLQKQGPNETQGGLEHRFIQNSTTGVASQISNQVERQVQRRLNTGILVAEQHGPVRKGTGIQTGPTGNTAKQTQDSTQISTPPASVVQTNIVGDTCVSTGNCTANQSVNENGNVKTNMLSGSTVSVSITCGGGECEPTAGPPPIDFASGTWSSGGEVIGTAFVFRTDPGGDQLSSVSISGPSGWNDGAPVVPSFYDPPGMAANRAMFWGFIDPVTGTYTATGTGTAVHTGTSVLNSESTLPEPTVNEPSVDYEGGSVSVSWTGVVGAQSYLVRVFDTSTTSITGEQVVSGGTTSDTLTGLTLNPGDQYQLTVFAFSNNLISGAITEPFNMSSGDAFFGGID